MNKFLNSADSSTNVNYAPLYDKDMGTNCGSGWICPDCGRWVSNGESHQCYYPHVYTCYSSESKTENAYKILKVLVEEKIIKEPTSFKKFCDLIEKLAKVI